MHFWTWLKLGANSIIQVSNVVEGDQILGHLVLLFPSYQQENELEVEQMRNLYLSGMLALQAAD